MKTVLGLRLSLLKNPTRLKIPKGGQLLHVACQPDLEEEVAGILYVEAETDAPLEERTFEVYRTGERIPEGPKFERQHVGSAQAEAEEGPEIVHVYERK